MKSGNPFLFAPFKHLFLRVCADYVDYTKFWSFSEPKFFYNENIHLNLYIS